MSEQQAQGADAVVDLNNELKTRREKLAALREQGVPFPNDFRRDIPQTNCTLTSTLKRTKSWKR